MTRRARVWYCYLCGKMNSSPGKLSRHMGKTHSKGIMLEANWVATSHPNGGTTVPHGEAY